MGHHALPHHQPLCARSSGAHHALPAAARVIYQNRRLVAFRDIRPAARTHLLVVPKEHIPNTNSLGPQHTELGGPLGSENRRPIAWLQGWRRRHGCTCTGVAAVRCLLLALGASQLPPPCCSARDAAGWADAAAAAGGGRGARGGTGSSRAQRGRPTCTRRRWRCGSRAQQWQQRSGRCAAVQVWLPQAALSQRGPPSPALLRPAPPAAGGCDQVLPAPQLGACGRAARGAGGQGCRGRWRLLRLAARRRRRGRRHSGPVAAGERPGCGAAGQ
jgi:hypothetical protein